MSRRLLLQYAAFGQVLRGMDVMHKLEGLPTKREGIFVMPIERVTIQSTCVRACGHVGRTGAVHLLAFGKTAHVGRIVGS